MEQKLSQRLLAKIVMVLITIMGLGATSVVSASAQEVLSNGFSISNIKVTVDGVNDDGTVTQYSTAELSLDWKAPDAGIRSGDTLVLKLPDIFSMGAQSIPLVGKTAGGASVEGADCVISGGIVTCTFNEQFENLDNVEGSMNFRVKFERVTELTDKVVAIEFNGVSTTKDLVVVDQNGNQVGEVKPYTRSIAKDPRKTAWIDVNDPSGKRIIWEIVIPSNDLADPKADVVITDQLSGNHVYDKDYVADSDRNQKISALAYNTSNQVAQVGSASATYADGDTKADITVHAPAAGWNKDQDILIIYATKYTGEGAIPFTQEFQNNAAFLSKQVSTSFKRTDEASGTIKGVDRGTFALTKEVVGEAASQVPPTTAYTVHVVIDLSDSVNPSVALPNTEKATNYRRDGNVVSYDVTVTAGETVKGYDSLPQGSKITLTELAAPTVDRVKFADPEFGASGSNVSISDGNKAATIYVAGADSENAVVTLKNTANPANGTLKVKKVVDWSGVAEANRNTLATVTVAASWPKVEGVEETSKTLNLPVNGEAIPLGVDLPIGTEVTLVEQLPEDGHGVVWSNAPTWTSTGTINANVATVEAETAEVTVTNVPVDARAGLQLIKAFDGDQEAVDAVKDETFTAKATWTNAAGQEESKILTFSATTNGELKDLPAGTKVTVEEIDLPELTTVTWGDIAFEGNAVVDNGDGTAVITVPFNNGETTLVTVKNTARQAEGAVSFSKKITGEANLEGVTFKVNLRWADKNGNVLTGEKFPESIDLPSDGTSVELQGLPAGTVVAFAEDTAALPEVEGVVWAAETYAVGDVTVSGDDRKITVSPGGRSTVVVNNRIIPSTDVEVAKVVSGFAAHKVKDDHVFQVKATWVDVDGKNQEKLIEVTPGTPADVTGLPLNTEIRLEEVGAEPVDSGNFKWADVVWSASTGADLSDESGESRAAVVTLTGNPGEKVKIGLENKTSANGLIIIPLPIPPITPPTPNTIVPPTPTKGVPPAQAAQETQASQQPQQAKGARGVLANTGASVVSLGIVAALLMLLGLAVIARRRGENS